MKSYPLLVTLCVYFLSATNVITFQKDWKPFSFRMIYKFLRFSYMLKLKITEDSGLKNKFSRHYEIKVYLFLILCIIMTLSNSQHFTKIHMGNTLFGFCFKCFILWIYILRIYMINILIFPWWRSCKTTFMFFIIALNLSGCPTKHDN